MAKTMQRGKALFPLGRIVSTRGALSIANEAGVDLLHMVSRHVQGDWSEMDGHDKQANRDAIAFGNRVFSAYTVNDRKFWVITEADRASTTILLPEEY
jgi:hypothetical protein